MQFFQFFKNIGHDLKDPKTAQEAAVAGSVISAFNPAVGSLVSTIANAAYSVEMASAPGTAGADKKKQVEAIVAAAQPIVKTVEPLLGPSISKIIDEVVKIFNLLGIFSHAAKVKPPNA